MGSLDFAALRRAEVGGRLRVARERLGLSLAEIESATRVPARHLDAIERGDASTLPSPAYATGFVRGYARQVGLDANALVRVYRGEAEDAGSPPPHAEPPIETAAEAPPSGEDDTPPEKLPRVPLMIGGVALCVLLLLIGAALLWKPAMRSGASIELPPVSASAPAAPIERLALPPIRDDTVALTARARVWMRVYEQGGRTLFTGILAPGGSYRVPADARDPRISTGNPGALAISVGGMPVARLAQSRLVTGARLSPAALRAPRREMPSSPPREHRHRRKRPPEPLPALEVTTEAAAPSVTTPIRNAQ